jgi:chromate transporter
MPSLLQIFLTALRLGCTSFGGPVAHLAFFRKEYVERQRWLDDAEFADLVALCQFLPGPASSQTGFGIGWLKRGLAGGLAAWVGFTLPSALLMLAFAAGVAALGDLAHAGWLHGLKAAAVAVVSQAVWLMSRTLCPDWPRRALAVGSAAVVFFVPLAWSQVAVIAAGALAGMALFRGEVPPRGAAAGAAAKIDARRGTRAGSAWLALFFALLMGLPLLAGATDNVWAALVDKFYRVGSLVFGGGHVVLPLLEREVVGPGWLTADQFLAGYGAVQAVPGPLFTFSAYLGALHPGGGSGGLVALLAIFLPALLLVLGVLPWWQTLRHQPRAQAALRGANAAVVGVLLAALIDPVGTSGLTSIATTLVAAGAFAALQFTRTPVWLVVMASALLGQLLL